MGGKKVPQCHYSLPDRKKEGYQKKKLETKGEKELSQGLKEGEETREKRGVGRGKFSCMKSIRF